MKTLLLLLLALVVAQPVSAHRDRVLSVAADGAIPELPEMYASTRLQIKLSSAAEPRLIELAFSSSGQHTTLAPCLLAFVNARSMDQVSLSGSWYHEEELLPHYVHISLRRDAEAKHWRSPRVEFLFSLRDARLIQVTDVVAIPGQDTIQHRNVVLKDGCPG
jgi:hypothetical protein